MTLALDQTRSGYNCLFSLIAIWLLATTVAVNASCGDTEDFPNTYIYVSSVAYGCSGIYDTNLERYVCSANVVKGCGGEYMQGPGNCNCTGAGSVCDQSFVGPPNPLTIPYSVYQVGPCEPKATNDGCTCPYTFIDFSDQTIANCMACPAA